MSAATDIQGAMALAQSAPVQAPKAAASIAATKKVAQQFEGVLISQMLNGMFEGVKTDGMFGGGQGEEMFRSLMIDEYGKQIAAQGGLGLSAGVTQELLKQQGLR
jgi:Rod binding domain-containing protein